MFLRLGINEREKESIVVIGGNGFIGKHLLKALQVSGHKEVRLLTRQANPSWANEDKFKSYTGDLNEPDSMRKLLDSSSTVVNLAYNYSGTFEENTRCAENLAAICAELNVKRVIHCSTASVFGRVKGDLIDETTVCLPRNPYGLNKLYVESIFKKYSHGKYELYILRPTSVFGRGSLTMRKLVRDIKCGGVISNFLREIINGDRSLNLLHISVLVDVIIYLIETDSVECGVYNVSQDNEPNNNYAYVAEQVYSLLGRGRFVAPNFLSRHVLEFLLRLRGRDVTNSRRRYSAAKLMNTGFKIDGDFHEMLSTYLLDLLASDRV